jgi:hypothetical protein
MSFPGRILSSNSIFKPALHYLSNLDPNSSTHANPQDPTAIPSTPTKHSQQDPALDSLDSSPFYPPNNAVMSRPSSSRTLTSSLFHSRDSSGELEPGIPLVDYSRTPSPSPYRARTRSATQSEDEDDNVPVSLRPLVGGSGDVDALRRDGGGGLWRRLTKTESLGGFLFGTWGGWQVYVGLLMIWSIVVAGVLVLMNRFILWSKFKQSSSRWTSTADVNSMHSWRIQVPIPAGSYVATTPLHTFLPAGLGELDEGFCAAFTETWILGSDCTSTSSNHADSYIQDPI